MSFSNDRERHNDEVVREHKAALARGEKRVLRNTKEGGLRSYPADEIGFSPGRGQPQVTTWWGMGILFCFMVLLGLGTLVVLFAVLASGGAAPAPMGAPKHHKGADAAGAGSRRPARPPRRPPSRASGPFPTPV
ncbi:hypothetical protein [Arthrobacter sp. RAF14]|uniref:hypothetical protein n=1 Tax=Arthrobacter sp. RAF14 TaxID=3233051 RepID=UPI003F8DC6AC